MHLNYQQFTVAFAIPPRACKKPGPDTTRHTPGLEGRKKKKKRCWNTRYWTRMYVFKMHWQHGIYMKDWYCNQKSFINPIKKIMWTVVTCHPLMQCLCLLYTQVHPCFTSWFLSSVLLLPHLLHHLALMWIWYAPPFFSFLNSTLALGVNEESSQREKCIWLNAILFITLL